MRRIQTANREIDKFGPGKDGFRSAVPGVSEPTYLSADFFNQLQESIVRLIESAGLIPSNDLDQFTQSVRLIVDGSSAILHDQIVALQARQDILLVQAGAYPTEAEGRAAVADGQIFKVQGAGDVAAFEYRRTNAASSVLIALYPSISGITSITARARYTGVYDVADATFIIAGDIFRVNTFRYGREDGSFIAYTADETLVTALPDTYVIADCRGATPVLSVGTRQHAWEEVPHLVKDVIILAYKETGVWHSGHISVQRHIDSIARLPSNIARARAVTVYDVGDITSMVAGDIFVISTFRYGRADGSFAAYNPPPYEVIQTPEANTYIVADCRGDIPILLKGQKPHVWEEVPYLVPDVIILAYKESGVWHSDYVNIQKILSELKNPPTPQALASTIYDVADSTVVVAGNTFSINVFRFGRVDGRYSTYTAAQVFQTPEPDTYIVADCRGANPVLRKGSLAHAWEEVPRLVKEVVILAYKESGFWHSDFINIQRLIDRANGSSAALPFTTTDIVVKAGGAVGVDCQFTDIKSALDSIHDNSAQRRYNIRVRNGLYDLSDNGFDFLGVKNYVDVIGQSRAGVVVVKRDTVFSSTKAGFDPAYYGERIDYAALRSMTIITKNCKSPVHADGGAIRDALELYDLNLLNEEPIGSPHYMLGLACGLEKGQKVRAYNCFSNGQMYAHNNATKYDAGGCEFELHNCIFPHTVIGDLATYGFDKYVIKGCKLEYILYDFLDIAGLRPYIQPSWTVDISGNQVEYIAGHLSVAGQPENALWDFAFAGKFGITDASIHAYHLCPAGTIARGGLVALSGAQPMAIKPWAVGDALYGVAMDMFSTPADFGVVQYAGTVFLTASGALPIGFGDAVELDASGIAVKYGTGRIIGHARQSLDGATAQIKVKLI